MWTRHIKSDTYSNIVTVLLYTHLTWSLSLFSFSQRLRRRRSLSSRRRRSRRRKMEEVRCWKNCFHCEWMRTFLNLQGCSQRVGQALLFINVRVAAELTYQFSLCPSFPCFPTLLANILLLFLWTIRATRISR